MPSIGTPLAGDLVDLARLRSGERVLDVACGTGVVARLAAERVGKTGAVAGLDVNPGMLAVAQSVTPGDLSIEWYEASAEAMPLPDETFDVVLCQLGLQFVPDKLAALREMRRVLAPTGRLAINLPGALPPVFEIVDEALGRHIGPDAAQFVRVVFSLHDPSGIDDLIRGAGFQDVRVERRTKILRLPPPEEFLWQYVESTPLSALAAKAGEETRAALERDVVAGLQPFVEAGTLLFRHEPIFATARK